MDGSSDKLKMCQQENILPTLWLAIDEISMAMLHILALLSQVCGKVQPHNGNVDPTIPFRSINILLLGDFHLFEPVGQKLTALYSKPKLGKAEKKSAVLRRNLLYAQFETIMTLMQQMRITDEKWMKILQRAQKGDCSKLDLGEIRSLVLHDP